MTLTPTPATGRMEHNPSSRTDSLMPCLHLPLPARSISVHNRRSAETQEMPTFGKQNITADVTLFLSRRLRLMKYAQSDVKYRFSIDMESKIRVRRVLFHNYSRLTVLNVVISICIMQQEHPHRTKPLY